MILGFRRSRLFTRRLDDRLIANPTALATYSYDSLGRRSGVSFGNGTSQSFGYDAGSRLTSLTSDLAGTGQDQSVTFGYNPANQIATTTRSNDAYAWREAYSLDRLYSVDGLNRFLAAGGVSFGYDARGNLTSSGTLSYGYSAENRLVSAPGVTLGYDPVGRLAQVTASAGGTGGGTVTRFAYVGLQMVAEAGASGTTPLRRYVYGPGLDSPIVWYEGSGTDNRRFLLADERGSIVSVADSTGAVLAINTYDEFGIPASTNVGRFQFTGQAWLPEAGLFYYKARMYSPTLGRFLQTDPIGYADGLNWYNYVGGDPINSVDPLGLVEVCFTVTDPSKVTGDLITTQSHRECTTIPNETPRLNDVPNGGGEGDGDIVVTGRRPESANNGCPTPAISRAQRQAAQNGDRSAFWNSRLAAGDPLAGTALSIVNNSDFSGQYANFRLRQAIITRSPTMNPGAISQEVEQIGVELMQAHVAAVDSSGANLSAGDIARYHFRIFEAHGLPASTFGGAALTGTEAEAGIYSGVWRHCP